MTWDSGFKSRQSYSYTLDKLLEDLRAVVRKGKYKDVKTAYFWLSDAVKSKVRLPQYESMVDAKQRYMLDGEQEAAVKGQIKIWMGDF